MIRGAQHASRRPLRPHDGADRAGEPRVGSRRSGGVRARRIGCDVDAVADFDAALDRARATRRDGARHRLVPHRRRCDGAVAGVAAGRVALADGSGRPPRISRFLSRQFAERAHIMGVWRDVARRFAFVEYDGPPLEPLDLYTKKSGDEIVGQLYNFMDKGGREVALRPEMTPTLARMVAAQARTRCASRCAGSRCRSSFATSGSRAAGCASTSSSTSTSSARPTSPPTRSCSRSRSTSCARCGLDVERRARARLRPAPARRAPGALGVTDDATSPRCSASIDKLERQPRDVSREKLAERRA